MGLVVSPAGQTGSPYLKIWTVCLFEDYLSVCTLSHLPSLTKAQLMLQMNWHITKDKLVLNESKLNLPFLFGLGLED